MTDIATRIEKVCSLILDKEQEFKEDRESISNRPALLIAHAIDQELLYEYTIKLCEIDNINPDAVINIMQCGEI